MKTATPVILLGLALASAVCAAPHQPPRLVLTGVGRFAILADLSTIRRDGDLAQMRSLQVAQEDFTAGGQAYWGGWSWWSFDCRGLTADRLDFASVREGGAEGPATPDAAAPYPAAPGGDAAELLAAACDPAAAGEAVADSLEAAVRVGREALRSAR